MLLAASDSVDGTCLGMFDMSSAADDMNPTWYAAACCMFHSDKVDMADMGFCPRVGTSPQVPPCVDVPAWSCGGVASSAARRRSSSPWHWQPNGTRICRKMRIDMYRCMHQSTVFLVGLFCFSSQLLLENTCSTIAGNYEVLGAA